MKLYKFLIVILLVSFMSSCIKDDTNTDFKTLVKPVLVVSKDPAKFIQNYTYVIERGSRLVLSPDIEYHDMSDLSYQWFINGVEVSNSKDLDWEYGADFEESRLSGTFKITRNSAGNSDIYPFVIEQLFIFQQGFMIMAEKNGQRQMHFIQDYLAAGKYVYDWVENATATDFSGNGMLREYWSCERSVMGNLMYIDSDPNNCYTIEGKGLLPEVTLKEEFVNKTFPAGLEVKDLVRAGGTSYVLSKDNKVYVCYHGVGYFTGVFEDKPMKYNGKPIDITHICQPTILSMSRRMVIMYDGTKGIFYALNGGYSSGSVDPEAGIMVEIPLSPVDVTKEELMWIKDIKTSIMYPPRYLCQFKNKSTGNLSFRMFQLDLSGENLYDVKDLFQGIYATVSDITPNSIAYFMNCSTENLRHVIYTDGIDKKKVYVRPLDAGSIGAKTKLVFSFTKDVVALSVGRTSTTHSNIFIGFEDGTFMLYNAVDNKRVIHFNEEYNPAYLTTIPEFETANVGKFISVDFKYGLVTQTSN